MSSEARITGPEGWRAGPRVTGAGGVEIATWDLGGSGPPLLVVHATGFHARIWLPLAPALRARHRLWAVDQRGHGRSGHAPDRSYRDWGLFVTDLLAVVDALDLGAHPGGLSGAGHSLGGAILLLAEQRRPGTFGALYCYEPIVLPPSARQPAGGIDLSHVARKRRARFGSRAEARANYAGKPPFDRFGVEALDAYVEHGFVDAGDDGVALACPPEEEASVYEGAVLARCWEHLGEVRIPVTLTSGGDAGPASAHIAEMAELLPQGRSERYDELTHFGPMEDPLRVGAAIDATLG